MLLDTLFTIYQILYALYIFYDLAYQTLLLKPMLYPIARSYIDATKHKNNNKSDIYKS